MFIVWANPESFWFCNFGAKEPSQSLPASLLWIQHTQITVNCLLSCVAKICLQGFRFLKLVSVYLAKSTSLSACVEPFIEHIKMRSPASRGMNAPEPSLVACFRRRAYDDSIVAHFLLCICVLYTSTCRGSQC